MFLENEHQPIISHSPYDLARPLEHHHHHHLNHHAASNHLQSSTDHLQEDSEGRSTASSPTSSYRDLSGCEDFDLKIPKPSGHGSGTGGNNNNNNHNNNNNKEQKPKKHKCKHCGLECTEKVQYWKHIRTHIKPEQLLECPNCEFATDLKHHYEYHLLNHTGAKPFTCPDCDYKCVSKSMLQSHLKSHSNVFQFQCYDCGYASKYMHSLKQHLKKRDHRPATPLNPDGTPNPDIVIDVVGNRRGPRQNKKQNRHNPYQQQHQQQQLQQSMTVCSSQDDGGSSSGGHPSPYSMQQLLQMPASGCAQVTYPTSAESFMYSMITKRSMEMVDYQAAEYMAIKNNNNNNNSSSVDDKMEVQQHHQQSLQHHHNNHHHKRGHQYHSDDVLKVELAGRSGSGGELTPEPHVPVLAVADPSPPTVVLAIETGPLNLSRDSVAPRAAGSSRRKGIACKLERPATESQPKSVSVPVVVVPVSPAVPMDCSSESRGMVEETLIPVKEEYQQYHHYHQQQQQQQQQTSSLSSTPEKEDKEDETHVCHHCDIIFKENIMYSMHMGFHSFRDPFACNLCGEITADKFSFFAHIARVPHS